MLKSTTNRTDVQLQDVFAALRTQLETVLGNATRAERRDDSTATAIFVRCNSLGTLTLESLTASGYEVRFSISASGEVTFYQVDGFAMRLLEAWALEIVESAREVVIPTVQAPAQAPAKARCPFHANIRKFFAAARDRGLDTTADGAMRLALSNYFDRAIMSRQQLSGAQWFEAAEAVQRFQIAW